MDTQMQMFYNRLSKMYKHRSKLARRQQISCYRLYEQDLTEFPLCIEIYGDRIYVAEYAKGYLSMQMEDEAWREQWLKDSFSVISAVTGVATENMYIRQRKKMAHRSSGAQYEQLTQEGEFFTVEESGMKFRVNLTNYLDSGLFLDHRITRQMVKEQSADKRVLNLFCYTGSFSVYAACGNAASVISVDLSKTYLTWAEENFKFNKLLISKEAKQKFSFVHADVKQYLKTLEPESFDLVVMDPPTFSNSKRMKDVLDIQADHAILINDVMKALTPGGKLYFSTNFTRFVLAEEQIKASKVTDITKRTTPFDFEGKLKRWCYLIER